MTLKLMRRKYSGGIFKIRCYKLTNWRKKLPSLAKPPGHCKFMTLILLHIEKFEQSVNNMAELASLIEILSLDTCCKTVSSFNQAITVLIGNMLRLF